MGQACACMGPQPGHLLCPCAERLESERQRVRAMGLPTDLDTPMLNQFQFQKQCDIGHSSRNWQQ